MTDARKDRKPLQELIDPFVRANGGELVTELISSKNPPPNADYFFKQENVIVELKALEENSFGNSYREKLGRLIAGWHERGLLLTFGTVRISFQDLHPDCQREWSDLLAKPLQTNLIGKANNQIGMTKTLIRSPTAKGVVMIASDGNEDLEPSDVWFLLAKILQKVHSDGKSQFSNIDGLIYFTPRMLVHDVTSGMLTPLWLSCPRVKSDSEMVIFLNRLAAAWPGYLETILQIPVVLGNLEPVLENTKFLGKKRGTPHVNMPDV